MRIAKVLVTDLSSKGKKIFHYGDEVNETNFHPGSFEKLLEGKFLEENFKVVEKAGEFEPLKTDFDENLKEKNSKNGDEVNDVEKTETNGSEKKDEEESSFAKNTKKNFKK